jgi:hypothetical protein
MDERRLLSLDPILEEVRSERAAQLRHFDALDSKAGIILGFAGALVALAPTGSLVVDLGRLAGSLSGIMALLTFWPRGYWSTDLLRLRDLYLTAQPEFTKLNLLDTQIGMTHQLGGVLKEKATRLKWAMGFLAAAALLTALGLTVD